MNNGVGLKGILGLGAVSTAYYVKGIHKKHQEKQKEFSTCPFLMYHLDFQEINPFLPDHFEVLIPKLKSCLMVIINLGITDLLIPNITLYESLDQIEIPLEIFHPVGLTLKYLLENNIEEAYLFGTLYTMNSSYFQNLFLKKNVHLFKPTLADQIWIDDFRKRIYEEKETLEDVIIFQNLIQKYSLKKAVIIACTELSVFSLKKNPLCIDIMDLQVDAFIK